MRLRAAILSLLPGLAHIHLDRPGRGLLLFAAFALALNLALLGPFFSPDPRLRAAGGAAAVAVWILAFFDSLRLARPAAPPPPPAPEAKPS